MQMLLQKRIERKTASLLLYALQIASSNLKRVELEKPQPEQVVTDFETEFKIPIAAPVEDETVSDSSECESVASKSSEDSKPTNESGEETLPPGSIQACEERKLICAIGFAGRVKRSRQSRGPLLENREKWRTPRGVYGATGLALGGD